MRSRSFWAAPAILLSPAFASAATTFAEDDGRAGERSAAQGGVLIVLALGTDETSGALPRRDCAVVDSVAFQTTPPSGRVLASIAYDLLGLETGADAEPAARTGPFGDGPFDFRFGRPACDIAASVGPECSTVDPPAG